MFFVFAYFSDIDAFYCITFGSINILIFLFSDEIAVTRIEQCNCNEMGNPIGLFAYDYKIANGCMFYRGHTGALWSGNQTLTSGGCSWWYTSGKQVV